LLYELKETAAPTIAGLAADERADVDEIVAMLTGNFEKIAEHGRKPERVPGSSVVWWLGAVRQQEAGKCYALPHYAVSKAAVRPAVMGWKLVKTTAGRNCSGSTPSTPRPGNCAAEISPLRFMNYLKGLTGSRQTGSSSLVPRAGSRPLFDENERHG
jgi:hypothetical protein